MKTIKTDKAILGLCATSLILPSCSNYIIDEYNINENAIYGEFAKNIKIGSHLWHNKNGNTADSTFYEIIHKQSEEIADQYASLFKDKEVNVEAVKQFITYNLSGIYGLK